MNRPPMRSPGDPARRIDCDITRRTLISLPMVLAATAVRGQQGSAEPAPAARLALLIGNRVYPDPFDLPPTHKNVHDLEAALAQRDFKEIGRAHV